MDSGMFIVTFVLGVVVLLVAIIALFKSRAEGGGSLEFGGFKLAGTGAPSTFLLVGVVLLLSGVNGYSTTQKNHTLTSANQTLNTANRSLKESVVTAQSSLAVEQARTRILLTKIPPQTLQPVVAQHPELFAPVVFHNLGVAVPPMVHGAGNP